MSRKTLSKVLNGRSAVTPEMALRLEMVFGKPDAAHWLRLQSAYDLQEAKSNEGSGLIGETRISDIRDRYTQAGNWSGYEVEMQHDGLHEHKILSEAKKILAD